LQDPPVLRVIVCISREMGVVTLINVFEVTPGDQRRLVELLVRATEEVMRDQPGYVSANIHRSLDAASRR
jgi:hypothetical protein